MKVSSILDIMIELAMALVALPFVMTMAIKPWSGMGGFESKIEKTALETSATLEDDTITFTGADMYLSLAVSDSSQPQPNKIRFYSRNNTLTDGLAESESDGFKDYGDNYFQVFYSSQHNPSTINNKVSVGRKVIASTNYIYDSPISLTLKPKTSMLNGEISNNPADNSDAPAWFINCDLEGLSGNYKDKGLKHNWFCLK